MEWSKEQLFPSTLVAIKTLLVEIYFSLLAGFCYRHKNMIVFKLIKSSFNKISKQTTSCAT